MTNPNAKNNIDNMNRIKDQIYIQKSFDTMATIANKVYNDKYIPQFYMAVVKQVNDDGTINVMTNGSTTQLTNIPNYTRCDLGVNDKVYLLAIQGDLTNCCALFACGATPPKIGYAGAYLYADDNSGKTAGLVCENPAKTSKTVINADNPFTVYKLENGNWKQVGGITAEGDFCASRLTNETDDANFYAIVGANENNNLVFEIHQIQSNGTDLKIFQFWQSANNNSVLQYGNDSFAMTDKNNNVRLFFGNDNSFVIGNGSGKSQVSATNDQVTLNALSSQVSALVNNDGLGIVNNGWFHSFNTNPSTKALQTDGVDTWSGTLTLADGTKLTYTNGLLTGIGG